MTKPTGRPRGRPKTKEYVTLMARVPQDLADQARRYAGCKRYTMSEVLRDGLLLLLDQEQAPPFVYDRKEAQPTMMSDTKEGSADIMSDRKDEATVSTSDLQRDTPVPHAVTPRRARSAKVSDTKGDMSANTSDTKADVPPRVSDTKAAQTASTPEPAILSDRNIPAFDPSKYVLGKLCPRSHQHGTTGQSLLKISNRHCPTCDREKWHEKGSSRRQAKRQTVHAMTP